MPARPVRLSLGSSRLPWWLATVVVALGHSAVPVDAEAQTLERPVESELPPHAVRPDVLREERDDSTEEQEADIFARNPMARAAGWFLRPEPAPSGREEEAEENLDRYLRERLHEDRLTSVGAHPWYHQMQRAMRRTLRPDMDQFRREQQAGMNAAQQLYNFLRRYGNGPEPPQDVPGQVLAAERPELDGFERQMQELADIQNLNNAPVTWYRVDVRVAHNPEGEHIGSWVIRSSGYDELDRAALEAVRTGAQAIPVPPPEIVGDRDAIRSDWAVEIGDVATYINTFGCVDDPVTEGRDFQCVDGLGTGIVRTRIRLLRVVDAEQEMFEDQRFRHRSQPPRLRGE
ncbi:MAG: energy transducer TonB [Myxococcota bacterium]